MSPNGPSLFEHRRHSFPRVVNGFGLGGVFVLVASGLAVLLGGDRCADVGITGMLAGGGLVLANALVLWGWDRAMAESGKLLAMTLTQLREELDDESDEEAGDGLRDRE